MTTPTITTPVRQVADEVWQVRLPLPFALNHVNCYLLRGPDGWTILDTGLNWSQARAGWQAALGELNIGPDDIDRIVLTHMHPDHFGLAGWFQEWSGEPVLLSPREEEMARHVWIENAWRMETMERYWVMGGITTSIADVVASQTANLRSRTFPHPTRMDLIAPGETVEMGGRRFQSIHAPGHSDGQLIFYDADDRLLLVGDQVLIRITPNIGLWPSTEPDPLGRYLRSLRQLEQLDVRLALPGHGPLITDWRGRLAELQAHHDERLQHMFDAVDALADEGATALNVSRIVFNYGKFSEHEVRFALAETLAHLEHLVLLGQLAYEEDEVRVYHKLTIDN